MMSENSQVRKLTTAEVEAKIKDEKYIFDGRLTICILTLENGFKVVGVSCPIFDETFVEELGKKYAREKAVDDIWSFEAFNVRQKYYESLNSSQ